MLRGDQLHESGLVVPPHIFTSPFSWTSREEAPTRISKAMRIHSLGGRNRLLRTTPREASPRFLDTWDDDDE